MSQDGPRERPGVLPSFIQTIFPLAPDGHAKHLTGSTADMDAPLL